MGWGQDGYDRRIEVFLENSPKKWGVGGLGRGRVRIGGGGVRVDVIEELKFLGKCTKNGGSGGGVGRGGQVGWGVRVDVNEELKFL